MAKFPFNGCRRSMMMPVSGSNPPQKLSGASAARAAARADACDDGLDLVYASRCPWSLGPDYAAGDRRFDALLRRRED